MLPCSGRRRVERWIPAQRIVHLSALAVLLGGALVRLPSAHLRPQRANVGDSAMFGGSPSRNLVNLLDKGLATQWSVAEDKPRHVKWVATPGTRTALLGQPVIAEGKVFVAAADKADGVHQAVLTALCERDGRLLWRNVHTLPGSEIFREVASLGLLSTPAVERGCVYYVTPSCEVVCAAAHNGEVLWRFDMMARLGVVPLYCNICSPLVAGDLVFVVTGNGVNDEGKVQNADAPSFVALHKDTGKLAWQSSLPGANVIEGQWSSPAYGNIRGREQVIFAGGDATLYSFEPKTGKLLWHCRCHPKIPPRDKQNAHTPSYFLAMPVIHDDKIYIGMGLYPEHPREVPYGYFLCLDAARFGDVSLHSYDPKARGNEGSALVWAFGGPIAPRPKRGRPVYFRSTVSTAAVHEGLVYIAEQSGYRHCLDARTGQRYWVEDLRAGVWGSPYWVDGKVYLGAEDGEILAFAHGREKRLLLRADMEEPIYSTPAVARGVLYLLTRSKLYAIQGERAP